jgi:hypothetical protein
MRETRRTLGVILALIFYLGVGLAAISPISLNGKTHNVGIEREAYLGMLSAGAHSQWKDP